jgi:very-short-patch-repair endonuclease
MRFKRSAGQTARARHLRQQDNPAEASLWSVLRNRQLGGSKFVRQLPVGPFYADFACRSHRLIVEVDGSQHVDSAYDAKRDAFLVLEGWCVMRVPSATVLRRRFDVCETILAVLEGRRVGNVDAEDLKLKWPSSGACRATFSRKREK